MRRFFPDLLCITLLVMLSVFFYRNTIAMFPAYIHAWTQADRYALALKFTDNGLNLFKPQTFNLMTEEGVTGVDLPVHEWVVAAIMKVLGDESPAVFRLYVLCLCVAGCTFLFGLVKEASGSAWKGLAAAIFVFSCPVLTYYQAGFVPSATSFAVALIGYYFYFRYQKHLAINDLRLAVGLLTLAALSRLPFNICLFATLLGQVVIWLRQRKINRAEAVCYAVGYGVIIAANLHKFYLEKAYGSLFLNHLMAADNFEAFSGLLSTIRERWALQVFTPWHYSLLALSVFFLTISLFRKKTDETTQQILLQSGLNAAGGTLYFVLMIRQFVDHEYYFIDSHYMAAVLLLSAGIVSVPLYGKWEKIAGGTVIALLLAGGIWQSKSVQIQKYTERDWDVGEMTRRNFEGAAQLLDTLQIPLDAKMLVIDAYSFNVPLILMNRMGHTVLSTSRKEIGEALRADFDYIVIQDIFLPSEVISNYPELVNQLERVGGNGRVSVFRYDPGSQQGNLKALLGIKNSRLESTLDFEPSNTAPFWKSEAPVVRVNNSMIGLLEKNKEFGPGLMMPTDGQQFQRVLFEGNFYTENKEGNLQVVASIEANGKATFYHSYPIALRQPGVWTKYQCLFDILEKAPPGSELKCYLWNPGGAEVRLDNLKVTLY